MATDQQDPTAGEQYVSVAEAARQSGTPVSVVRAWVRDGAVRSRTGLGPRGERIEVAVGDLQRAAGERQTGPGARGRGAEAEPPGQQLVPLQVVEAMERLSGELYLAGQRAARAEAVAELRERRLLDLQQEVDDLQHEATDLWEQNQDLRQRLAGAQARAAAAAGGGGQQTGGAGALRAWWRRTPPG